MGGAYIIRHAVSNTENYLWAKTPATATIARQFQRYIPWAEFERATDGSFVFPLEWSYIEWDLFNQLRELPSVKNGEIIDGLTSEVFLPNAALFGRGLTKPSIESDYHWIDDPSYLMYFPISGITESDFLFIREGLIRIENGRSFTQEELVSSETNLIPIIISEEMSAMNRLDLGAIISLENLIFTIPQRRLIEDDIQLAIPYEFEIVGIFSTHLDLNVTHLNKYWESFLSSKSFIPFSRLAPLNHAEKTEVTRLQDLGYDIWFDPRPPQGYMRTRGIVFEMHDARDLLAFRELGNEWLPTYWRIAITDNFVELLDTLTIFQWYADAIMWGSRGALILIFTLLTLLFLRERKSEIGVYLALGEKKIRILGQLLIETMIVVTSALTVSLGVSFMLASSLSNEIILHQLQEINSNRSLEELIENESRHFFDTPLGWIRPSVMTIEEKAAVFNITLDKSTIFSFYLTSLGIITITSSSLTLLTLKKAPTKILEQKVAIT
jgi:putative ABC transport system permease protein